MGINIEAMQSRMRDLPLVALDDVIAEAEAVSTRRDLTDGQKYLRAVRAQVAQAEMVRRERVACHAQ